MKKILTELLISSVVNAILDRNWTNNLVHADIQPN